jgi:hypothetical protein
MARKLIFLVVLIIVVGFIFKRCKTKNNPSQITNIEKKEVLSEKQEVEQSTSMLKYRIVEKKDISFSGIKRMTYRMELEVDSIPSIYQINDAAIHYWKNIKTNADEFTFFIYLPAMSITEAAYGVVEFSNAGMTSSNINKFALYGTKWEVKENKNKTKKIPVAKLTEYRINLSAVKINGNEIKISIETNFPDGTNFLLGVGRTHYLKGENEEYSGKIFDKDFSVQQGKIETTVKVNDSEWYNKHLSLVKALPNDIKPISKISDNVTISVLFSPKRKQSASILKIVGTDGEYITGKGAENEYGFTTFNVSKDLNIPLQR